MRKLFVLVFWMSIGASCEKKVDPDCIENVNSVCGCPKNFDPVCGCNGKTYGNPCMAECAGIKKYTKGECGK